nr:MAG TPA: hypothetical protein [Caudoviricetes sp.]
MRFAIASVPERGRALLRREIDVLSGKFSQVLHF